MAHLLTVSEMNLEKTMPVQPFSTVLDVDLLLIHMVALIRLQVPPAPSRASRMTLLPPPWKKPKTRTSPPKRPPITSKTVLGVEKHPPDGTSLKTPTGDAQGEMTIVTHGQPWITVTRHRTMHVTEKQRPPRLERGEHAKNWRAEPGLYSARLQESCSSIATNTTKPRDQKKNKTKKTNKKNNKKTEKMSHYVEYAGRYRMKGMYHYLVEQLDKLDIEEFTIALKYWMDHFNFPKEQDTTLVIDSTGAVYDESRYPNAQYKPSGKRFKANGCYGHITAKRNQALAFACRTLSKLHRQAQLTSNAAASASTRMTMPAKFNRIFAKHLQGGVRHRPVWSQNIPRRHTKRQSRKLPVERAKENSRQTH
jgi:hypothetical protein